MKKYFGLLLLSLLTFDGHVLNGQSLLTDHDFHVIVAGSDGKSAYELPMRGHEQKNNALNRLSIISESQYDYPDPESGCGPIALLNTLVWYQKYGLIQPLFRDADARIYKNRLFAEIDARILKKSGLTRSERNGSRNMDVAMVLDEIVNEQSNGELRVHADYYQAPLQLPDLLETMPNFRTGYLLGYPKDPRTGQLLTLHAATLIRADRAGYITLATWGQKYRGLLRMRNGEQWFIPQDPTQAEIKMLAMMRFIPFKPATASGHSPQ